MTTIITLLVLQFSILTGGSDATKSTTAPSQYPAATTCGGTGDWVASR